MAVSRCRPCKLRAAFGTVRLGRSTRLLSLVSQEVAEGGELPPIAPVLPTLRLWSLVEHSDGGVAAQWLRYDLVDTASHKRRRVAHAMSGRI